VNVIPQAGNRARMPLECAETIPPDVLTLNTQGKPADEVWTQAEWDVLCRHLHNGNGDQHFVMAWRKEGQKHYAKSAKVPVSRAIPWAWRTIDDQVPREKRTCFVPYSQNSKALSRWGCLDFDAHDGEWQRAQAFAVAAFQFLLNSDLTVIFEHTGGGWHVWTIAQDFREVRDWTLFLRGVAKAIEAPIQPGICEVFPDDGKAKGVRAPGSWNPSTDSLNGIFWENTAPLIKGLRSPIGKVTEPSEEHLPNIESNIYGKVGPLYPAWQNYWKDQFAIIAVSIRHQQLLSLVAEMFHQIGYVSACKIVETHYREASVPMQATREEHIKEFEAMWSGLHQTWLLSLHTGERIVFDSLRSENERDGFRIVKSFQRKAAQDGRRDFPVARNNFAARLGITHVGGGHVRDRLAAAGVIELTTHYVQYRRATHYRWLLEESP
jgi:hypothetical protein